MIIDVRSEDCVFITIRDRTYYIDDSTGEHIVEQWETEENLTKPLYYYETFTFRLYGHYTTTSFLLSGRSYEYPRRD